MRRTSFGFLALGLAAVLAGGCGGGDEDDDALSKPEYVKRANAVCRRFNGQIEDQAQRQFAGIESEEDLTAAKARRFLKAALPKFERSIADLRALKAPDEDSQTLERIYDAAEAEKAKIARDLADDRKVKALATSESVTPRFEKLARDYGLEACAES